MESNLDKYRKEIQGLCKDGLYLKFGLRNEMHIRYMDSELEGISEEKVIDIKKACHQETLALNH